jgi:hypothetical protein
VSRLLFNKDQQIEYFKELKNGSHLTSDKLGEFIGISGRSFRDWMSGKTLPTNEGVKKLSKKFNILPPKIIEIRSENWSGSFNGRNAALARIKKHGPPGTKDGRKKGGKISQLRRRENPELYKKMGCIVRNNFNEPQLNEYFAELIGIILGDGCLTKSQCQITLHKQDDKQYSKHVLLLIKKVFKYKATIVERKENAIIVLVSGVNFTKMLVKHGVKIGNKIKNQVDMPNWIKTDSLLLKSCMRGLFDTDGGTVVHNHTIKNKKYTHFNICFSNNSTPLLNIFHEGLKNNKIKSNVNKHCVMVYNIPGINKFFKIYQPNNPKHLQRYINWKIKK